LKDDDCSLSTYFHLRLTSSVSEFIVSECFGIYYIKKSLFDK